MPAGEGRCFVVFVIEEIKGTLPLGVGGIESWVVGWLEVVGVTVGPADATAVTV